MHIGVPPSTFDDKNESRNMKHTCRLLSVRLSAITTSLTSFQMTVFSEFPYRRFNWCIIQKPVCADLETG